MIKINLLTSNARNKSSKPGGSRASGAIVAVISLIVVLALGGGGAYLYFAHRPASVVESTPAASGYKPSSHVKPNMIEDVVREVSDQRAKAQASGLLDIDYSEMSFGEKINYEAVHARNVVEMLGRAVPPGIGLKTLELTNFQTVYAVGLGTNRDLVTAMFTSLKGERIELLGQPYSYIQSNGSKGFRFVVTCKTRYGLDMADPFQAIDYLAARDDITILLKKVSRLAQQDGLKLKDELKQVDAEKVGSYRRFTYTLSGSGSYKNFVKFVLRLYNERVPCAFKKVRLVAQTGALVDIKADILFTVRD